MKSESPIPPIVLSSLGWRGSCLHHFEHCNNTTKTIGCSPTHKTLKQKVLFLQPSLFLSDQANHTGHPGGVEDHPSLTSSHFREAKRNSVEVRAASSLHSHDWWVSRGLNGTKAALYPQNVQGCRAWNRCPRSPLAQQAGETGMMRLSLGLVRAVCSQEQPGHPCLCGGKT